MTPLAALQLLEQATSHLQADRETHVKLMEAAKIVGAALMEAAVQKKISSQSVKADTDG